MYYDIRIGAWTCWFTFYEFLYVV